MALMTLPCSMKLQQQQQRIHGNWWLNNLHLMLRRNNLPEHVILFELTFSHFVQNSEAFCAEVICAEMLIFHDVLRARVVRVRSTSSLKWTGGLVKC